uniref:Nucleolar protein 7 n=1 Tax=Cyprinus carpio TaxID=7962 RepID=A0A8C2C7A4_CYPCA
TAARVFRPVPVVVLIWRVPSSVCTKIWLNPFKRLTKCLIFRLNPVMMNSQRKALKMFWKQPKEKNLLKEKRKKRQQLFQEQKKRKRLPQELLEEFDKEPQKVPHVHMENVSDFSLPDSYRVTRIKDESAAKSLQQKAVDFIQSRLYGPGTIRTTNAELLSLRKKRGANQGAAVGFLNKKLGASQKARIARSNKRFIHQQKLIPL